MPQAENQYTQAPIWLHYLAQQQSKNEICKLVREKKNLYICHMQAIMVLTFLLARSYQK